MIPVKKLAIAVIGDEDLVNGMRLAGINRYKIIDQGQDVAQQVRENLNKFMNEPEIGLVIILEDYLSHVEDILGRVKASRKLTPVIIEIPSMRGTSYGDTKQYYKAFIRKYIGFDVEI